MAKYIKKEIADLNGTGSTQVYYRMQRNRTIEHGEFIQRCHKNHRLFGPSVLLGAVIAVCEQLAEELADGNTVKIEGLGAFHAKLGLNTYKPGREMDTFEEGTRKRNAASLGVTGIGFRADKELVRTVAAKCQLQRGGEDRIRKSKYTKDERVERAIQYLRKEGFMHVKDYAKLNDLSYTSAYKELRYGLVGESGVIKRRGSKSSTIFFLQGEN